MTCRCDMCGRKNAGKRVRRSYLLAGIFGSEKRVHGADKRRTRKLRRTREKRELLSDYD